MNQETGNLVWQYALPNGSSSYPVDCPVVDGIAYAVFDNPPCLYAFGIGPTTTEVSATDSNVANGTTIAVSGRVYDESPASPGAPVTTVPVKLMMQKTGENSWTEIATVVTDDLGRFVSQWTPQSAGTYTVMAKFDGSGSYGWSSQTAVVNVNSATPSASASTNASAPIDLYIIVATILVIIAIALAVIILRKR